MCIQILLELKMFTTEKSLTFNYDQYIFAPECSTLPRLRWDRTHAYATIRQQE